MNRTFFGKLLLLTTLSLNLNAFADDEQCHYRGGEGRPPEGQMWCSNPINGGLGNSGRTMVDENWIARDPEVSCQDNPFEHIADASCQSLSFRAHPDDDAGYVRVVKITPRNCHGSNLNSRDACEPRYYAMVFEQDGSGAARVIPNFLAQRREEFNNRERINFLDNQERFPTREELLSQIRSTVRGMDMIDSYSFGADPLNADQIDDLVNLIDNHTPLHGAEVIARRESYLREQVNSIGLNSQQERSLLRILENFEGGQSVIAAGLSIIAEEDFACVWTPPLNGPDISSNGQITGPVNCDVGSSYSATGYGNQVYIMSSYGDYNFRAQFEARCEEKDILSCRNNPGGARCATDCALQSRDVQNMLGHTIAEAYFTPGSRDLFIVDDGARDSSEAIFFTTMEQARRGGSAQ